MQSYCPKQREKTGFDLRGKLYKKRSTFRLRFSGETLSGSSNNAVFLKRQVHTTKILHRKKNFDIFLTRDMYSQIRRQVQRTFLFLKWLRNGQKCIKQDGHIAIPHQRIGEEAVNHCLATCILYPFHFHPVSCLKNPPLLCIGAAQVLSLHAVDFPSQFLSDL